MPFLLAEILNFQGSTHRIGVGSFSNLFFLRNSLAYGRQIYFYRLKLVTVKVSCESLPDMIL